MATTLTRTIYGTKHDLTLEKFNVGSLTKAVTFDLEEFGVKGVQGVVVKGSEATALIKKYDGKPGADNLYCVAGTSKGNLVFLLRDKVKTAFEAGPVTLVKDYDKLREKLATNTGAVRDVSEEGGGDKIIDKASFAHGDRLKTDKITEGDTAPMNVQGITGDIVLCAHGTPKVLPGRVIGSELGAKSPDQIVNILIGNSDPKKRLSKDYNGKVTLAGCFTSSGGPEADKQDDPFAKKVHDLLVSKGYTKVSVVGMAGPSWTGEGKGSTLKDQFGSTPKRGEEVVTHDLEGTEEGIDAIRLKIDQLTNGLWTAAEKSPEQEKFFATPAANQILDRIKKLEEEIETMSKRVKDKTDHDIKGLTGTFGLRSLNAKTKGKFAKFFGR